ncbi:hypothetical protein IFM46972_05563 [Aspergillus udagawae]|uniref:Uncharacterized protein n=1 Tax=Aspergillus udagawae TaxID=91492 RepID=A0A8H3NRJ6_9EURO|nr:hypothetical protein IFM46972_05563 [Aspergillus udagawae]
MLRNKDKEKNGAGEGKKCLKGRDKENIRREKKEQEGGSAVFLYCAGGVHAMTPRATAADKEGKIAAPGTG